MKSYVVDYTRDARKSIDKLDKTVRIIADIQDDKVVILVIDVVKRNDAYK